MTQFSRTHASRLLTSLVVCVTTIITQAQLVFIPDVQMRAWLNELLPGVVDGDGYMNTADPDIPLLTSCDLDVTWDPADLTGLEYLSGLDVLEISFEAPEFTSLTLNALPPALSWLIINHYPATTLPPLPWQLDLLRLYDAANLTSLSGWPPGLGHLQVTSLPAVTSIEPLPSLMRFVSLNGLASMTDLDGVLPGTITWTLELGWMPQLSELPALPAFSEFSEADTLILTNLPLIDDIPSFPDHIAYLKLEMLPLLTSLPPLPAELDELEMRLLDLLDTVPSFPSGTSNILLQVLPLVSSLPTLPASLHVLQVYQLPALECLPHIPQDAHVLMVYNSGVDCVPNIPAGLSTTLPLCGFYNTISCPFFSPSVSGTVYHDMNANGLRDAGEPGVGYAFVDIAPGNTITGVADNGFYAQALDVGTYTITANVNNPYVLSISPVSHSTTMMNASAVDSLNDFGVVLQANVQDLAVNLGEVTPARPGFTNHLYLAYDNQGTIDMSGTVSFTFDDDQTWSSSTPPPDALTGTTATWNLSDLLIGEHGHISISLFTDPAVLIGTPIIHTAVVDPAGTDQTPVDNVTNITTVVVGAYDPNDKTVSPSEITPSEVSSGERLTYTIRFQNTGTYPAERVIITDTLSTDLQWSTMDLIASSHPCTWFIHEGTLRFTFDPINLPDSTSNEPASHGFVTFSLAPSTTLSDGMLVGNTANIYFDFNVPVITNEALFSVIDPQGIAGVAGMGPVLSPNPVHDVLRVGPLPSNRSALTVLDAAGRRVTTTLVTGPSAWLDVSALPPGAYQLRLEEEGVVRHFVKY